MMPHDDKSKLKLLVTGTLRNAVMLAALAPLCLAFSLQQANGQSKDPQWGGTWVLQKPNDGKKNSQIIGNVTLIISQTNQRIRVFRKLNENGDVTIQELNYYTDGRGEANPSTDRKRTLRSDTQLRNNKLVIKFSPLTMMFNRRSFINERVDEWKLSSDGETMTQTSWLSSSPSDNDAGNNPFGSPRATNVPASPRRWKEIRVFKRVP